VQKLGDAGIASVADSLKLEESEVADILESSGYTTYKHRYMLFNMNFPQAPLGIGAVFSHVGFMLSSSFSCCCFALHSIFLASLLCWVMCILL
jgi:hypothetical protein